MMGKKSKKASLSELERIARLAGAVMIAAMVAGCGPSTPDGNSGGYDADFNNRVTCAETGGTVVYGQRAWRWKCVRPAVRERSNG